MFYRHQNKVCVFLSYCKKISKFPLIVWQSLKKRNNSEVYLKPYQTSMMDLFPQKWLTANLCRSKSHFGMG